MTVQSEAQLESELITQLNTLGYANVTIKDESQLLSNLKTQIEANHPGAIVLNLHPGNVDFTDRVLQYTVKIASQRGWISLGVNSLLTWLETLEDISIQPMGDFRFQLASPNIVKGLVIRYYSNNTWHVKKIKEWVGNTEIIISSK